MGKKSSAIDPIRMTDEQALQLIKNTLDSNKLWRWWAEYCVEKGNEVTWPEFYDVIVRAMVDPSWLCGLGIINAAEAAGCSMSNEPIRDVQGHTRYKTLKAPDLNMRFRIDKERFCKIIWGLARADPNQWLLMDELQEKHKAWVFKQENWDWW